ncbi:MAG: hypothetical protein DRP79_08715, partial [Planctomycetota bacterium]
MKRLDSTFANLSDTKRLGRSLLLGRVEAHVQTSMASVRSLVQSWLKDRFPERKFDFVHFSENEDCLISKGKLLLDFLKEKTISHEIVDPFLDNHYEWRMSHIVTRKRGGELQISDPRIRHHFGIIIDWQGTKIVVLKFPRLDATMFTQTILLLGAVENLEALKEFMRELELFNASRKKAESYIECYNNDSHPGRLPRENLRWDEIVLQDGVLDDIREDIESFFNNSHLYRRMGVPYKRGIILTGSPGNGKTLLCRIIASNFRQIPFAVILAGQKMENGNLDYIYSDYSRCEGAIICIEDLDTMFDKSEVTLSGFLNILDGIKPTYGILTIATTNKPGKIDPALLRRPSRFDRKWVIHDPNEDGRRHILKLYFRDTIGETLLREIAAKTEGWSAAYLKELFITSGFISVRDSSDSIRPEHIRGAYELLNSQHTLEKRDFNPAA